LRVKLLFAFLFIYIYGNSQKNLNGEFKKTSYTYKGNDFVFYDFPLVYKSGSQLKTIYFAKDAYQQFLNLKEKKEIILATSASFTNSFLFNGVPVGLCADNGLVINKMPDKVMDGIVILFNNDTQKGKIVVADMDEQKLNFQPDLGFNQTYNPREHVLDTYPFFKLIEKEKLSVFQTQLLYTSKKLDSECFKNLQYGNNDRTRRFLVIANKNGQTHQIIIDALDNQYLIESAKNAKDLLQNNDFKVLYILNLDTGCKNILYAYNGSYLENLNPNPTTKSQTIEEASNLLVYYKD
jgi:hypothetical protein